MPEKTEAEWVICNYATKHPTENQKQVAKATGYHPCTVSATFHKYFPDRVHHYRDGETSPLMIKIREYVAANPDMQQKDIAKNLGCSPVSVNRAINQTPTEKHTKQYDKTIKYKDLSDGETRTCLGEGCHKKIPRDLYIHFCEECQKKRDYMQYIPNHSVYIEGHGRV